MAKRGRKLILGLDYFPVDVGIYDDDKIVIAQQIIDPNRTEHWLRYSVPNLAIRLLKEIYKKGYFLEWNEMVCIALSLEMEVVITSNLLSKVASCLIESGFFNKDLFDKYGILTSNGIQKRWLRIMKNANRKGAVLTNYNLISSEEIQINGQEIHEIPTLFQEMEGFSPNSANFLGRNSPKRARNYTNNTLSSSTSIINNTLNIKKEERKGISSEEIQLNGQEIDELGQEIHSNGQEITANGQEITKSRQEIAKNGQEIQLNGQEIKHIRNNVFVLEKIEVDLIKNKYFSDPMYEESRTRLGASRHMDFETMELWADKFNEFLITSGKFRNEKGKTVKEEVDWCTHFSNWLVGKVGKKLHENKKNGTAKNVDIDELIKLEKDPEKRKKLREEKYKIKK